MGKLAEVAAEMCKRDAENQLELVQPWVATIRTACFKFPYVDLSHAQKQLQELQAKVQQKLGNKGKVTAFTARRYQGTEVLTGEIVVVAEMSNVKAAWKCSFKYKGWRVNFHWQGAGRGDLPDGVGSFWALNSLWSKNPNEQRRRKEPVAPRAPEEGSDERPQQEEEDEAPAPPAPPAADAAAGEGSSQAPEPSQEPQEQEEVAQESVRPPASAAMSAPSAPGDGEGARGPPPNGGSTSRGAPAQAGGKHGHRAVSG